MSTAANSMNLIEFMGHWAAWAGIQIKAWRLLAPFALSSTPEARGIRIVRGLPRVAFADSLTRAYFLKPLRDC